MVDGSNLERLQKAGRVGVWIVLAAIVVVAVLLALCILGLGMCYADPHLHNAPMDNRGTIINYSCNILTLGACLWACILSYEMLDSIKDGASPFTRDNVGRMRDITATLGATFVGIIVLQVLLMAILQPHTYVFDVPLHILITTAISFVFTLVFEYGGALQTESDGFL